MAFLEVDPIAKNIVGLQALPIYTVNLNPWVRFQPKVLIGSQARRVLQKLIHQSWRYGTRAQLQTQPTRITAKLMP